MLTELAICIYYSLVTAVAVEIVTLMINAIGGPNNKQEIVIRKREEKIVKEKICEKA